MGVVVTVITARKPDASERGLARDALI